MSTELTVLLMLVLVLLLLFWFQDRHQTKMKKRAACNHYHTIEIPLEWDRDWYVIHCNDCGHQEHHRYKTR
jgi:hypothetical protein